MMPDLGKYADVVLSSYAVSILLIVALVGVSIWRARRIKAELDRVETRGIRRG
ncbi:heme exporter protein CcmD [Primorskyibacter marinus]|uniref:heme exporter protein CcmD n=1 Tax=Primorskyibacter marinus TaxID=1977320 RepID=UPI0018E502A1|nr:heme exporter protein CcmD [Primorskyibacter marinus]